MSSKSRALAVLFALGVLDVACGGGGDNLPPPPPPPPPGPSVDAAALVATPPPQDPTPPKPAAPPVTLTAGAASPEPAAPLPTVKITAPTKDQVVAADKAAEFAVKLDVKNWQTATGSSHVHLILDNRPYKPIYDTKAPVKLSELTSDAIAEGPHVLVAFASRANHESVKTKDAFMVVPFWVGKKGATPVDVKKPMLVFSRPKGDYKGEMANHVLVDFYLLNAQLAEGKENVKLTVTGPGIDKELTAKVEKWGTPYYLDNLQNGSYSVKAELAGTTAADGYQAITRSIHIDHDAPADPAAAHGGHALGAADAGAPPAAKADAGAAKPTPKPAGKK